MLLDLGGSQKGIPYSYEYSSDKDTVGRLRPRRLIIEARARARGGRQQVRDNPDSRMMTATVLGPSTKNNTDK